MLKKKVLMNANNETEQNETSRPVTATGFPVQLLAAEIKARKKKVTIAEQGRRKKDLGETTGFSRTPGSRI